MPTIPIDDWKLHYQRLGEGPDVVLLHGLSGDGASWHPAVVSRLASERRVTLCDLRGHGRSGRPASGYTTRELADDVARLLDALEVPRAHVVGHSFGGAVALHFCLLHKDRARSLVLADARVRSLQPAQGLRDGALWRGMRERLLRHGVAIPDEAVDSDLGLMNTLARYRVEGRLEGLSSEPFFIPFAAGSAGRASRWLELMRDTTAPADFNELAGLTPEAIEGVVCPVLLLYGELSHCLPTRDALAGLLRESVARTIAGAGHFHPFVKPEAFLAEVTGFLDRTEHPILPEGACAAARPVTSPGAAPSGARDRDPRSDG